MHGVIERRPTVVVLLATCNGADYLDEQFRSLEAQTVSNLDIWVSDDGSSDDTLRIVESWQSRWLKGRIRLTDGPRRGFAANFRHLLLHPAVQGDFFAFCDQDDIWEKNKLERAVAWLNRHDEESPALHCTRTKTISEAGLPIGQSPLFRREPSFQNALVQSIAGGNTMVFNASARNLLVDACRNTEFVSHDWWAYLLVSGAGGKVCYSPEAGVRYRQHRSNQVGSNATWRARLSRLNMLFSGRFFDWTSQNLDALNNCRDLLTPDARGVCDAFTHVRDRGLWSRLRHLHRSGVYRQTLFGSLALYLGVALRRI